MITTQRIQTPEMVAQIEALAPRYPNRRALTLPALHIVNDCLRYVPFEAVVEVAQLLGLAPAEVQDTLKTLHQQWDVLAKQLQEKTKQIQKQLDQQWQDFQKSLNKPPKS